MSCGYVVVPAMPGRPNININGLLLPLNPQIVNFRDIFFLLLNTQVSKQPRIPIFRSILNPLMHFLFLLTPLGNQESTSRPAFLVYKTADCQFPCDCFRLESQTSALYHQHFCSKRNKKYTASINSTPAPVGQFAGQDPDGCHYPSAAQCPTHFGSDN